VTDDDVIADARTDGFQLEERALPNGWCRRRRDGRRCSAFTRT
jgi:hypothetical protein